MIERSHLQMIKAIQEHGTVTAAANQLCLTQSALSHSMKKLESFVGFSIWRKKGRSIELTKEGERLLSAANRILPLFSRLEADVSDIAAGIAGKVRIGIECYPCFDWLMKIVAPFLKQYPEVEVDIKNKFNFGGIGALFAYDIDLLITPDPLIKKGLEYIPVLSYEQKVVVAKGHTLAAKNRIAPEDLEAETFLSYPIEKSRLDLFTQFLDPAGRTVRKIKNFENTEMILQMVASNRGFAVLPQWLVGQMDKKQELVTVPIGKNGINKQIHIGIRADETPPRYLSTFIAMAQQSA